MIDTIIHGNSLDVLTTLPSGSVDLVFADPPYNMQLGGELVRLNGTVVSSVDDAWDKFDSPHVYDSFTVAWLNECKRILKPNGALWVIGSYHNIYRVGFHLMELGYWILNDVHWHKPNCLPNMAGVRFRNASETLLWCAKSKQSKVTFNHSALKAFNDDVQMSNVWTIPTCQGKERLRNEDGSKVHSTQKPEALLYRVILATTNAGDVVLDPFFGSGTTGAACKKLGRHYIGIEQHQPYIDAAERRLSAISAPLLPEALVTPSKRLEARVSVAELLAAGYLWTGSNLYSGKQFAPESITAILNADSTISVVDTDQRGSIHQIAKDLTKRSVNGWTYWHVSHNGAYVPLDTIRIQYRKDKGL